jgi:eukaryotic-like serine/threonine-protein kinase
VSIRESGCDGVRRGERFSLVSCGLGYNRSTMSLAVGHGQLPITCASCGRETGATLRRCVYCGAILPAADMDPDATGIGGLPPGGEAAPDPDATRLGTPIEELDPDATRLGGPLDPGDADVTRLGMVPAFDGPDRHPPPPARPATSARQGSGGGRTQPEAVGDLVGQALGTRYEITKLLGAGGMGAVYQAWDHELNVLVALKTVRPEVTADPETARMLEHRFKQELLLARQVTHRNIVRVHDIGEMDGIKYITMPYLEGEDLATILKQEGKLPVSRVLPIVRQVVSGLCAAHEAGVVHRDLKPANIMVQPDGEALVMDFGVARASGAARGAATAVVEGRVIRSAQPGGTMAGSVVGTVEYMAPEQARAQPVDQRADVYAMGLIMYDMLLGRTRASRTESVVAELRLRMEAPPPPVRSADQTVPEPLDKIITRCIQTDPAARFATSRDLLDALSALDDQGKRLPIVRRLTWRVGAMAAVLVAMLLGATYWSARGPEVPVEYAPVAVIIADVENATNDRTFDRSVPQALRRALESASFITAFDRAAAQQTFRALPPGGFDETAARQVAIKQGLGVVLAGAIVPQGTRQYDITITASEAMTGNQIASVTRRASNKDQVLDAVTRLAVSIRRALGDQTSESAQQLAMKTISTTSLDVASHYAAAVDAQARGRAEEALEAFSKTVALDPSFGLGYQGMAVMSRNLGRLQDAEKYAGEALRYLDQMTERERYATRGYYYRLTGDFQQCVKEYGELISRFPADVPARNQRAFCLARLRDVRAAGEDMRKVVSILPNHAAYRVNLAYLLNRSGEFAEGEATIRGIEEPSARALATLALSQQGQGLTAEAAETYEKIRGMDSWGKSFGIAGLGDLAVYDGAFGRAARIFEEAAAAELQAKNGDNAALKLVSLAHAQLARGQKRAAVAAAERALDLSTAPSIRFLSGRILAEAGGTARAREIAAGFTSQVAAEPQAYGRIIEGGIALAEGNAKDAIRLLTEANQTHETWLGHLDLGRAFLAAGAFIQADSEFDRCFERRGEALALVDEDPTYGAFPIVHYYRGRAREGLNTANYADAYREYLQIRGKSTDDPLVPEVRKRIGD